MTQDKIDCYSKTGELIREGKCTCLTCKHIRQITKLIPDEKLRNKVLEVTDDLFESMAGDIIDLGLQLSDSKLENELLEKQLDNISEDKIVEVLKKVSKVSPYCSYPSGPEYCIKSSFFMRIAKAIIKLKGEQ